MAHLTTHVLDTTHGRPARGMRIDFLVRETDGWRLLASVETNADGRAPGPLLDGATMRAGEYELRFHVADYFRAQGVALPDPPFLDCVPMRFAINEPQSNYHVPLLCSPFGYTTYRGS